jgi:hypothetical protein
LLCTPTVFGWLATTTPPNNRGSSRSGPRYLDELDEYGVPANQRLLAALGPRVLRLAAERTAGAHPYNTTREHTAQAREIIGLNAPLPPEHKVVLSTATDEARAIARPCSSRRACIAAGVARKPSSRLARAPASDRHRCP